MRFYKSLLSSLGLFIFIPGYVIMAQSGRQDLLREAQEALIKASAYYYNNVASHGGYVYYYSPDLKQQWGEGQTTPDIIFVQPPGTPAVGMAYLKAYTVTGDSFYLHAARDAAHALVYGQLGSGGWTQNIHFTKPEKGQVGNYRNGKGGDWNYSSLDDGQTQAALKMLMLTDRAFEFKDPVIHESVMFGLDALLKAQFPNGAFPQVWQAPVEPKPVLRAKFPDYDPMTEGRIKDYWNYYTLNDQIPGTVADVLITAHEVYKDEKYKLRLTSLGNFLILAQMPDPQPGWCQQYNYEMFPIQARRFEPPAITAWESQDVMETLIRIAAYTGDKKYLEPIPRALEYYKKCILPDGRVARYYEFGTNRPLYMNEKYELTYDDRNAPAHYGWKQESRYDRIEKTYNSVLNGERINKIKSMNDTEAEVRMIVGDLDEEGRWISVYKGERLIGQPKFDIGFRYISSEVFIHNLEVLCNYISQ